MDLERLIANRELLERLSREYELLKASGAEVDYTAWVRQRLREAAAQLAAEAINVEAPGNLDPRKDSQGQVPAGVHSNTDVVEAGEAPGGSRTGQPLAQLSFTRRQETAAATRAIQPTLGGSAGVIPPETAWFLHGEGTDQTSNALAAAIYGPKAQGVGGSVTAVLKGAKATRQTKRVVIISPRKSPLQAQSRTSPKQHTAQAPPVSKLYTKVEPGLFSARPDAYALPQARARRTPIAATRPDWVNAASLQAALRGASSAVPHLQAAAERERRLALSTALARQTLAAGLGMDEARAAALSGTNPASVTAQAAQYDHVLQVAQQLAQQNEQLALAVQLNSAQLAQQQALLASALQPQSPGRAGAAAASSAAAGESGPVSRVEVESGPPPWFVRRAPGPAAPGGAAGGVSLSSKLGRRSQLHDTSKSPKKALIRPRSPPPPHAIVPFGAPTTVPAKASMAPPVTTTAKERDRTSRKDALKTLLKQVLGSAGLAGGKEGKRRLASSMAEAEKLVAAIHALARLKTGRDVVDETASGSRAMAVAGTQTSGRASASGADGAEGDPSAPTRGEEPAEPRPGSSRAPSRERSQAALVPAKSSAPPSRALSRQGSGRVSEPAGASGSEAPAGAAEVDADVPSRSGGSSQASSKRRGVPSKSASGSQIILQGTSGYSSRTSSSPEDVPVAVAGAPSKTGGSQSGTGTEAGAPAAGHARGPAAGARVAARGIPPGLLVESLEDQVQQIVERDASAAAELARLQKLDVLELRLQSMVDRVESKLARVLQPAQLNVQQLRQGATWGLHDHTPDGLLGAAAAQPVAADVDPTIAAVAAAIAAAAASAEPGNGPHATGQTRGETGAGLRAGAGGASAPGVEVVSPRSAGLSVLELQKMLIQLNRMESNEQEVRRKWLLDAKGPRSRSRAGQPIVVRDGVLGTLDPDDPQPPPPSSPGRTTSPHATISRAAFWTFPQPPTESALATVAADSTRTSLRGPGRAGGEPSSTQAHDGSAVFDQSLADPISDATLELVLRGRRRFLRAQKLADGDLLAAAEPSVNPVQIMEDLSDALLDEMLYEQAKELTALCDTLGERMVHDEVDVSDDD